MVIARHAIVPNTSEETPTWSRPVTRPRAADDFVTIRARMEELRREREPVKPDKEVPSPIGPKPSHHSAIAEAKPHDRLLPRPMNRRFNG